MKMKSYIVEFTVTAVIELDPAVISRVDDEWRSKFYNLCTDDDIVAHVCRNLLNGTPLSFMDGWADMKIGQAKIIDTDWSLRDVEDQSE